MATTILKHIKTNKKGNPHAHLNHSIKYILNPDKTDGGLWIGSNCGQDAKEIYDAMIQTKMEFHKPYGRQGYHYVISFAPGEATEKQAYAVGLEFCKRYLEAYDYCFAVHNDHAHMHVHIVFNSVDHYGGYKYQYRNGDWEKHIQPLVDEICQGHNLSPLMYDKEGKRIGKSYAEHAAELAGRFTGKDIIRMDIDAAIRAASSEEEYFKILKAKGYHIRIGHSERLDRDYVAYSAPGLGKARRDYNLGDGYGLADIRYRITHKEEEVLRRTPYVQPKENLHTYRMSQLNRYQICAVIRVKQAVFFQTYDFTAKEQRRVRQDLLKIDELRRECNYLLDYGISSTSEIESRLATIRDDLREVNKSLKDHPTAEMQEKKATLLEERKLLRHILKDSEETYMVRTDVESSMLTVIPEKLEEENKIMKKGKINL